MKTPTRRNSDDRLAEMILYISEKCCDDPHFGATKLNKILFFSDFMAYARLGRPISGATYRKLEHGPVPRVLPRVRGRLIDEGAAVEKTVDRIGYRQKRLIALREPDLDLFSSREIALIDGVIDELREMSAVDVSDLSHRFRGWLLAPEGADIPYHTIFIDPQRPILSESEQALGRQIAERLAGAR